MRACVPSQLAMTPMQHARTQASMPATHCARRHAGCWTGTPCRVPLHFPRCLGTLVPGVETHCISLLECEHPVPEAVCRRGRQIELCSREALGARRAIEEVGVHELGPGTGKLERKGLITDPH